MHLTAQRQPEKQLLRRAMAAEVAFKQWLPKYEWAAGSPFKFRHYS